MDKEQLTEADLGWRPGSGMIRPSVDDLRRESLNAHRNRETAYRSLDSTRLQAINAGGDVEKLNEAFHLAYEYYSSLPLSHFRRIVGRVSGHKDYSLDFANGRALLAGAAAVNPRIMELGRAAGPGR